MDAMFIHILPQAFAFYTKSTTFCEKIGAYAKLINTNPKQFTNYILYKKWIEAYIFSEH